MHLTSREKCSLKDKQPTCFQKAIDLLVPELEHPPLLEQTTPNGDRIDIRRIWACLTSAEQLGFYGAEQVLAVEREVVPKSPGVKAS